MVRRKRPDRDALGLPWHLGVNAVGSDPDGWRSERFEWARQHEWPPGKIGFLDFFRETRAVHRQAKGLK